MVHKGNWGTEWRRATAAVIFATALAVGTAAKRVGGPPASPSKQSGASANVVRPGPARPKLVVMIVVDQMRGDYVDKFQGQWSGGLKRLVQEGAWFRNAAYPYAATETCVGHSTISTGAFPTEHGMIANQWWERETQKLVTCTYDPQAKNIGYAGLSVSGGDSAVRMLMPAFAEELKFQAGGATRVVTFSLKARAALMLAGHKADAATWFDDAAGAWVTSDRYGTAPFIEEYAKAHPARGDYGKTWALSLPENRYFYDRQAIGAESPGGWGLTFPHALRGKAAGAEPDSAFYAEWHTSPYADTALTRLAETAIDSLGLGKANGTDYLGVSYSPPDAAGHLYGPRSWEIQDILIRLDRDLAELFTHLDRTVGRGNYVVALSADHGVGPTPEDIQRTGVDAGILSLAEVQDRIEKTLEPFNYPHGSVARITSSDVYFAAGVYERLQSDAKAMTAVLEAIKGTPGVEAVYRAEDLADRPATHNPLRDAMATSYFAGRSGDLFIVPRAYWFVDHEEAHRAGGHGASHGTPWNYDQHVPILFMGLGIKPGQYFEAVTPADIAPTLAALCGVTLAAHGGHVLGEALGTPKTASQVRLTDASSQAGSAKP